MYRNIENIEADRAKAAMHAPPKVGLRNSVRSNIGYWMRASTTTKATSRTAAPMRKKTISVLPQPSALPRTSAKMSRKRPPEKVTRPSQSLGPASGSLDSATLVSEM